MDDRAPALTYVASPNSGDAEMTVRFLGESGIESRAFASIRDVASNLTAESGCLVLVDDVLVEDAVPVLRDALQGLPSWFDLPLIVVASNFGPLLSIFADAFPQSGIVTFLERPLNPHTLLSAVRVSLRASAHQREVGRLAREREEAVRLRDEFLAMLAHELRNPLASMRNGTYILRKLDLKDPRAVKTTEILDRQVGHLARMVDDLMDIERLGRSKMVLQVEPGDLNHIVASAVESALPIVHERGHRITVSYGAAELPVDVDSVRIEQAVCNLINNAAKFSPKPGEIRVHTSQEAGVGVITVSDDGDGFDADAGERLFLPFLQVGQPLARSIGGLGIGLTIVRRLIELHGGSVKASSRGVGCGATFTIAVPLHLASKLRPVAEGTQQPERKRRRVVRRASR